MLENFKLPSMGSFITILPFIGLKGSCGSSAKFTIRQVDPNSSKIISKEHVSLDQNSPFNPPKLRNLVNIWMGMLDIQIMILRPETN